MIFLNNSFGLKSSASELTIVDGNYKVDSYKPWFIIGDASNCIISSNLEANCIKANFNKIELITEQENYITCRVGASMNWHNFVLESSKHGWHGLENLALIPGTVGAAPVQNIGAYGTELSDHAFKVETIDLITGNSHTFNKDQCQFNYRDSIFKNNLKTHLITHVHFKLSKKFQANTKYQSLEHCSNAASMIKQIITTRNSKLPNPKEIGNCGSFFKNPIVDNTLLNNLPQITSYKISDTKTKLSAAALIEIAELKGISYGGAGISTKHSLVIVNLNAATYSDVKNLSTVVQDKVKEKFDILLETEVKFIDQSTLEQQMEQMA